MRFGIDVGGTFTDIVAIDDEGGITVKKTYTTPEDLSQGVINGIEKAIKFTGKPKDEVKLIIHGTTIGTNAIIERKGAKVGLLTTDGFRDVLEIGRIQRPAEGLYDFNVDNPEHFVPRYLRFEVKERVGSTGEIVRELDEKSVYNALKILKKEKVQAVAVCLLFSFLNNKHEQKIRQICEKEMPSVYLSLSSEVCPEFREYERTSTVVINAYIQPLIERYVERLQSRLKENYTDSNLRLIQANGGSMRASACKGRAINLVNSGPAGGGTAAAFIGRVIGDNKLISTDMGGTSFDICVIDGDLPRVTTEAKFEGYPIKIPMCDVNAIGAGGGSIAWIDKAGALNVGPQSAAAVPGPACYKRGGMQPTVTDANVVLGRIDPYYFLGGEIQLDKELATKAIKDHIASKMNCLVEEAAYGIIRVVNANMTKSISVKSTQKGYDLREFALVGFGGAGPLHAVDLAEDLGMRKVIIPPYPGAFSALGLLVADSRHDFVQTIMKHENSLDPAELLKQYQALTSRAIRELDEEGTAPEDRIILWSADLRFEGQSYELNVPVNKEDAFTQEDLHDIVILFTKEHERIYSFKAVDEPTIFVNARVTAIGRSPALNLPVYPEGSTDSKAAFKKERPVYFHDSGFIPAKIYERKLLKANNIVEGPAVIEEEISCTVIPGGRRAVIDKYGCVIINLD